MNPKYHIRPEVYGYCAVCDKPQSYPLLPDMSSKNYIFREKMICEGCGLNNRQRLMIEYFIEIIQKNTCDIIYVMEQVTPFYSVLSRKFKTVVGSEYLSDKMRSGENVNGIRHEDCMNLSFDSGSVGFIISNDVFEHIPDINIAFSEAYRVLYDGGIMLFSVPLHINTARTRKRAGIEDGKLVHYEEPQYHGNPVSCKGALVYYDFGQDILDFLKQAGFSKVEIICSDDYIFGHYGRPWIISAQK